MHHRCDSLGDLVNLTLRQGDELNCWICTDAATWRRDPTACVFYFIDEDEVDNLPPDAVYKEPGRIRLPLELKPLDLKPWFESGTLVGVLQNASIPADPNPEEVARFVHACNHYLEYDDFYDYPATDA